MHPPREESDIVMSIAIALVAMVLFVVCVSGGCAYKGKTTPAQPAVAAASENVGDADDHLKSAESHLRKQPPAIPSAQKDIGSARDQLTYAQGDLKTAAKSTSENDKKAAKYDEMQDDWLGPRTVGWLWLIGVLITVGTILRFSGMAFMGPVGAILSRIGSLLLAVGTMGLTAIQWIAEEVWRWVSSRKQAIKGTDTPTEPNP